MPELGGGYLMQGWPLQDASGNRVDVPIQITRLTPQPERFVVEAEEMTFAHLELGDIGDPDPPPPPDSPAERIIILGDGANINLRSVYDTLYSGFGTATEEDKLPITFILPTGRVAYSTTGGPSLTTGSFPTNIVTLKLIVRGRIQGMGGQGGTGGTENGFSQAQPGGGGGIALHAAVPLDLELQAGQVWGGGGGGGGAATRGGWTFNTRGGGGGGGAGWNPGGGGYGPDNAAEGTAGGTEAGGAGGASWTKDAFWEWEYHFPSISGGQGGAPGQAGLPGTAQSGSPVGSPGAGGAAGPSIYGVGNVLVTGSGSILGPQV